MKRNSVRASLIALVFAAGVGLGGGVAMAVQGHMWAALGDLQQANAQLSAALPDKGGHRLAAINLVNRAMNQVHLGIAAGAQ